MATPTTPIRLPGDPLPPPPEPRYPWRVGVTMLGLVVLVLVVVWLAFQAVKGPATAGQFPSPATATAIERNFEATVSAADTAQPRLTPQPTPQPASQAPVVPTSAPAAVAAPAVVPVATSQPAATTAPGSAAGSSGGVIATVSPATAPNAAAQTPTPIPASAIETAPALATTTFARSSGDSTTPTPFPTVDPQLAKQVSDAYLRYWQVVADTSLSLDPTPLDSVAAGPELEALRKDLQDDQDNGRATRIDVQNNFIVVSVDGDQAQVADKLRDLSIYVDPKTQEPLPGQVQPASPDVAPELKLLYQLRRIDGVWKVFDGGSVQ